jgi:hypothetical protein
VSFRTALARSGGVPIGHAKAAVNAMLQVLPSSNWEFY